MRIALTGTPGVGKTSAASLVRSVAVVRTNTLAESCGAIIGRDTARDTDEVDIEILARAVKAIDGDVLLEGHLSHLLEVDMAIVLRCSPKVLKDRLSHKGWSEAKVKENVEAEAVDVILIEAVAAVLKVCEVDTTHMSAEEVAQTIEAILRGESEKYPVGHVDWSQEVVDWF